jgi:hypothetical protein
LPHRLTRGTNMKQRNTDMQDRNGPRTGEVTAIFGLAYIRSK